MDANFDDASEEEAVVVAMSRYPLLDRAIAEGRVGVGKNLPDPAKRILRSCINERGDNRKPGITWGQWISDDCHYMQRWILNFGLGSIRVHHWVGSDDPRALHDHPWWFLTFVLRGGYTDISCPRDDCPSCGQHDSWAYSFGTISLRSFRDCRACGHLEVAPEEHLRAPAVRYRPALHEHTVQVDPGGAWTIMLTGRHVRDWGFRVGTEWKRMRKYFRDHGHHQCD